MLPFLSVVILFSDLENLCLVIVFRMQCLPQVLEQVLMSLLGGREWRDSSVLWLLFPAFLRLLHEALAQSVGRSHFSS